MNKNVLKKLIVTDSAAQAIEKHFISDEQEKDRIFDMSERKLEDMKKIYRTDLSQIPDMPEMPEVITVEKSSVRSGIIRAASAAAAIVLAAGVFWQTRNVQPLTDTGSSEESVLNTADEVSCAPESHDAASDKEKSVISSDEKKENVSATSAVQSKSDSSSQTARKAEKTQGAASKAASSSAPTDSAEVSAGRSIPPVPMPAVEIFPEESEISESSGPEESPAESENIGESSQPEERQSDADTENTPGEEDPPPYVEEGKTPEERLQSITPNMTIEEALKTLGEPRTCGVLNGYAEYLIGEKLIMITYTDKNQLIGENGEGILNIVDMSEMYYDPQSNTFDGYVIWADEGGAFRVTCPQCSGKFDCASVSKRKDNTELAEKLNQMDIYPGEKLRIKYTGDVLESYPPIIYAEDIDVFKEININKQ